MVAPTARPKRIARSTAPRFNTGRTPGSAISTAEACVFGAAPKAVDAPENIFDAVDSCACVSRPMTTSQVIGLPSALRASGLIRARGGPSRSWRELLRNSAMPVGDLLIAMRGVENFRLGKVIALDLQPDRQTPLVETAGNRHRRRPGQVAGDGENVVQVHLHRIVAFFSEPERRSRRCRPDDQVATVVGATEIVRDQPADLLRLQVVRVVVAVREHVGPDQDAALDLGAEAFGAG